MLPVQFQSGHWAPVVANLTVCSGKLATKLGLCMWLAAVAPMTQGGSVTVTRKRCWTRMVQAQPLSGL